MTAARLTTCTCPTGDGSLRWPCFVHLPTDPETVIERYRGIPLDRLTPMAKECYSLALAFKAARDALPGVWQEGRDSLLADFLKPLDANLMRPTTPNPYEAKEAAGAS